MFNFDLCVTGRENVHTPINGSSERYGAHARTIRLHEGMSRDSDALSMTDLPRAEAGRHLIPLTAAEVRRLFHLHTASRGRPAAFHEHWSDWMRRRHATHTNRMTTTGSEITRRLWC